MPSPREMRGQVYAGIVHGATGIIYFAMDSGVTRGGEVMGIAPRALTNMSTSALPPCMPPCCAVFVCLSCLYFATLRAKAIRIVCVCVCVRVVPVVGVNLSIGLAYLLSTSSRTNWIHV